jgi:hypothetical protein
VTISFQPRRDQAVGRIVVRLTVSAIVRPDETKGTTKFLLIDAVGPDLKDLKVGDVVMPTAISGISMEGGVSFRPMANDANIALVVRDWKSLDEFLVQNESGSEYVPFSDPRAAKALGTIGERAYRWVPGEPPAQSENGVERRP